MRLSPSALLKQLETKAKKRFGQHFLVSQGIIRKIIDAAAITSTDKVLEIGPGLGALTEHLIPLAQTFTAVELDRDVHGFIQQRWPMLDLIQGDAANLNWEECLLGNEWKCVSNLPYNVGTKIVTDLLSLYPKFSSLIVMLQKEVAEKMLAKVGDRNRGSLSVFVQMFASAKLIVRAPGGAFYPPPKVDSAVLLLQSNPSPLIPRSEIPVFEQFLRALFCQPRKTIRNTLRTKYNKEAVDLFFSGGLVKASRRPATLTMVEIVQIYRALE